jgi:hypothetical protein
MFLERIGELLNRRPNASEEGTDILPKRMGTVFIDDILFELGSEGVYYPLARNVASSEDQSQPDLVIKP